MVSVLEIYQVAGLHLVLIGPREKLKNLNFVHLVTMRVAFTVTFSFAVATLIARIGGSKKLVIIDTDPGIDDALAIFTVLGNPGVKVLAITCVRGNTNIPQVVVNTLGILQVAEKEGIPVYSGENFGLIYSPKSDYFFGLNGFQNVSFPNSLLSKIQEEHAASFLARVVKNNPGIVSILALGPLTNIALALELNPNFILQAHKVVVLGGSTRIGDGYIPPGLEFNFYQDPFAVRVVLERTLSSNTTITVVATDVLDRLDLTLDWRWNTIAKINNSVVGFLNYLEFRQQAVYKYSYYVPTDLYAAGVLLSPQSVVVESQKLYGLAEAEGLNLRGALVLDYRNLTKNSANVELILGYNITALKDLTLQSLCNFC